VWELNRLKEDEKRVLIFGWPQKPIREVISGAVAV
jgi:hypothetical protein